jgi:hypothetical protein
MAPRVKTTPTLLIAREAFKNFSGNNLYSNKQKQAFIGVFSRDYAKGLKESPEQEKEYEIRKQSVVQAIKALENITVVAGETLLSEIQRVGKKFEKNVKKAEKRQAAVAAAGYKGRGKIKKTAASVAEAPAADEGNHAAETESTGKSKWWKKNSMDDDNY